MGLLSFLGGIGSGLLSGLGSLFSQSSANDTNVQLQRETNEQNYKMFQEGNLFNAQEAQKNRDFQMQMFDATNEWNSALKQRERLEQAGLNPYLMMSGGDAGTAQQQVGSEAQAASANPAVSPHVQPLPYSQVGDAFGQFLDNEAKLIDLQSRAAKNIAEVEKMKNEGAYTKTEAARIKQQMMFDLKMFPLLKKEKRSQISLLDNQAKEAEQRSNLLVLQQKAEDYNIKNLQPKQLELLNTEIDKLVQDIENGKRLTDASVQQAVAAVMHARAAQTGAAAQYMDAQTRRLEYENTCDLVRDEVESRISLNRWNSSPDYNVDYEYSNFFTGRKERGQYRGKTVNGGSQRMPGQTIRSGHSGIR